MNLGSNAAWKHELHLNRLHIDGPKLDDAKTPGCTNVAGKLAPRQKREGGFPVAVHAFDWDWNSCRALTCK